MWKWSKEDCGNSLSNIGSKGNLVRHSFPSINTMVEVRNLMDLMHQPQWIAAACDRVLKRSHGKATGVDRMTAARFKGNRRAELEKLRLELKRGTYQPQPLRRVMIPKANGRLRGLGIPTVAAYCTSHNWLSETRNKENTNLLRFEACRLGNAFC